MLTVTLNAALDVTYAVAGLRVGESQTVETVTRQAGGKGLNVARVLAQLGHAVTVTGLRAGPTGDAIRDDLARAGLDDAFVTLGGESRRTVTVVDSSGATTLNEPGDELEVPDWTAIEHRLATAFRGHAVVVASGSLPRGVPVDAYARLTAIAHRAGSRIVVDASGRALLAAASGGADLLKPNAQELATATGATSVEAGAEELLDLGAGAVAVSLGRDGVQYRSRTQIVSARPPADVAGNPTGAGDALVAGLASSLLTDDPIERAVARGVALSAAAVAHPLAGHVALDLFQDFLEQVRVESAAR